MKRGIILALLLPALAGCHSMVELPRNEASDLLHALRDTYKAKDLDGYLAQLDPAFAATDYAAAPVEIETSETVALRPRGSGQVDRATFERLLRDELARWKSIERTKSHLIDMWPVEDDDDAFTATGLFRIWAVDHDGRRHYEDQVHRLHLVRAGKALKARSLQVLERRVVVGTGAEFSEQGEQVGLHIRHTPHTEYDEQNKRMVPGLFSGSGTCAGDVDGDGWLDVFVGDGERCRLMRNVKGERFEDITSAAGLDGIDKVMGAYLADVNGDGLLDVLVTRYKLTPRLFLNRGEARFQEAPEWLAALPAGNFESVAFGDLDGDGDLDAYVIRYGEFDKVSFAYPLYEATDGEIDSLLRNDGDRFTPVTVPAMQNKGWGRAVTFLDYDDDGDLDIYAVNDFGQNRLYRNDGAWAFTEVTEEAGARDQGFGMSAAAGDYDGDGDIDIFVTNVHSSSRWVFDDPEFPLPTIADLFLRDYVRQEVGKVLRGNTLLRNEGDGTFARVSEPAGVERGEWAWGATFFDYDNDGDLDIYCPNGYVTGELPEDT